MPAEKPRPNPFYELAAMARQMRQWVEKFGPSDPGGNSFKSRALKIMAKAMIEGDRQDRENADPELIETNRSDGD